MIEIDPRLLEPTCTEMLSRDLNDIMQKFGTISYLFPIEDSIIRYDTDAYGPFMWDGQYAMYTDTSLKVDSITTMPGNALKYSVVLSGVAKIIPQEVKLALFGAQSPITHFIMLVMEVPADSSEDILLDGNPIPPFRYFEAVNRRAYVGIVGVYNDNGVIKTVRQAPALTVKGFTVSYVFGVTNLTLEV